MNFLLRNVRNTRNTGALNGGGFIKIWMQFTHEPCVARCAILSAFFSWKFLFSPSRANSRERWIDRNRFHRLYLLPVCRFTILISTGHPTCNYGHLKALATCTLVCKQFQTRLGPVSRINGLTFNYQSTRGHCPTSSLSSRLV